MYANDETKSKKLSMRSWLIYFFTILLLVICFFGLTDEDAKSREVIYSKNNVSIVYDSDVPGRLEVKNKNDDIVYITLNGEKYRLYRTSGIGNKGRDYLYFDKSCNEIVIAVNDEEILFQLND